LFNSSAQLTILLLTANADTGGSEIFHEALKEKNMNVFFEKRYLPAHDVYAGQSEKLIT
jgi:hypothetical protein